MLIDVNVHLCSKATTNVCLTSTATDWCVLAADSNEEADSGKPELSFNPVALGKAAAMLPAYLQYEIKFDASQRQILVGRVMEALGKCQACFT